VAGSDPTLPANQDRLTPNVWITRALQEGIYNAKTETGFTHFLSPADMEWADGTTANYSSLSYTDWDTWAKNIHGGPPNTVGVNAVMHLISDNIYLDAKFTSWAVSGGGFSWQRSTPATADVPPTVAIVSPTNGASFTALANVPITASANDPDGSVTNVAFFDGATFLGGTNNIPYTVTASLGTGSHALTAVATDNGGLSTTSAVVNVTVSVTNVPPSVTITNPPDNSVFGNTDSVTIGPPPAIRMVA
jgi:Bacterial Ig domain